MGVKRATRAPKRQSTREGPDDPHRLANVYLAQCGRLGSEPTLRYWRGQWWRWEGGRYSVLQEAQLRAEVTIAVKAEFDRLARRKAKSKQGSRFTRSVSRGLVSNVLQALEGIVLVPYSTEQPAWLGPRLISEKPPHFLAMANGLLDLSAALSGSPCVLQAPSAWWFSVVRLGFPYDPTATCRAFISFLEEVLEGDQQRIALVQEWFGYCLTYDTSLQKFLVLEGEGANGKSVLLQVLAALLGEDNVSHVPLEVFGDRFQLTPRLGMLANIASEVSECDRVAEGPLKQFVGGDRMMFDRKNLAPVHALPTARLVMATNNLPRFADRSSGLWRRVLVLPFRVTIAPERQDPLLASKLKQERPGIFNWALEGLRRLRAQRLFTEPQISVDMLNAFRLDVIAHRPLLRFARAEFQRA